MLSDAKERFSATADAYERYRPSYPAALVDWLVQLAGLEEGARVVDLGSGTGISSRLLAERGFEVIGVEPNDDMRARAEARGGGPHYRRGEAVATGLPDAYAPLVIAAQAFHWFDLPATMRELARILTPGGRAAAFWNERASSPLMDAFEALLLRHSEDYRTMRRFGDTIARIREFAGALDVREASFVNPERLAREGFFGRVHSASYVAHGIADREGFERELAGLFDAHVGGDGSIEFASRTVAIAWRLR
jgi:SAM-dependent methyltransferase